MATVAAARSCRHLFKPSPLLAPIFAAALAACRYKDVILNRRAKTCRARVCNSDMPAQPVLSSGTSLLETHQELVYGASTVTPLKHLAATSTQILGSDQGLSYTNPMLPRQRRSPVPPRAFKDDLFKFRYPVITEKPEWWWRTLACVPYLIALQISDTGYFLQPFLEHYEILENLIYFVPGAINRLPSWFSMVYCYFAYIGIVKNKDWPHYFRFHLMMGMLLETALQIIWYTSNFMPLIHYSGRFGMHYWAAVGFTYIFVLSECVRCALGGTYARVPFISDAAYIHTLFNIGGYHRPF